ncbi:MAG: peptidase [Acidobacteria bacterium]|nr:peptidase [Acidobacteriota bacterium]
MIGLALGLTLVYLAACQAEPEPVAEMAKPEEGKQPMTAAHTLKDALEQYVPVRLDYNAGGLSEKERQIVQKLIQAATYIDEIFWRQVYHRNIELREQLSKAGDPAGQDLFQYFLVNYGPFDRLLDDEPFWGTETKPAGANFYPVDLTREEFETWLTEHPEDETDFRSAFTVIRREEGRLVAVPYHTAYEEFLQPAARLLREAAALSDSALLKRYLELRARDLLTDDFFESDMAWMDLADTPIEVVIGPYEVYEDKLFGYKAAYEAFITIRNAEESAKLATYAGFLTEMEDNLPIPDDLKNFNRGASSPLTVVDEVFTAGDTHAGVQTSAFNLPNDERVREAKGSKKVMLKNVMRAKFEKSLTPIALRILEPDLRDDLDFQSYFDHVVLHEISHGLGPGNITRNGKPTTVSAELKELYPPLEECKADIVGVWNCLFLADKGILPQRERKQFTTYLAGIFRSVRFGMGSAHGKGMVIQYNFLKEKGGLVFDPRTRRYGVNFDKIGEAVRELTRHVLLIQAEADYAKAKRFVEKYGRVPVEITATLAELEDIPVDIRPIYVPLR